MTRAKCIKKRKVKKTKKNTSNSGTLCSRENKVMSENSCRTDVGKNSKCVNTQTIVLIPVKTTQDMT